MIPITVAVAGSSNTISEYVARLRRVIASWSHTYGITGRNSIADTVPSGSRAIAS
jgi:hypothetical protein